MSRSIRIDDDLKRAFYTDMCAQSRWSVRTLRERMHGMLFERTAIAKQPDQVIRQELAQLQQANEASPALFLKDPTANHRKLRLLVLMELRLRLLMGTWNCPPTERRRRAAPCRQAPVQFTADAKMRLGSSVQQELRDGRSSKYDR